MIRLSVNNEEFYIECERDLIDYFNKSIQSKYSEIWIDGHNESSLCCLLNPECAFVMYLREEGDSGFRPKNREKGRYYKYQSFLLSNGQEDTYPSEYLVSHEDALLALLEYYNTGRMAGNIMWQKE